MSKASRKKLVKDANQAFIDAIMATKPNHALVDAVADIVYIKSREASFADAIFATDLQRAARYILRHRIEHE